MALNIKRAETEQLAREVARRTGETVTMAIERSLRERLNRLVPEPEVARRLARMKKFIDDMGPLPPGPTREEIDADMYDEWGLPR